MKISPMRPVASTFRGPKPSEFPFRSELAKRLEVTQGNVAQIEKRGDLLVSTLASYLRAVGGEVRIVVQFPGGHAIEVELDALAEANDEPELASS